MPTLCAGDAGACVVVMPPRPVDVNTCVVVTWPYSICCSAVIVGSSATTAASECMVVVRAAKLTPPNPLREQTASTIPELAAPVIASKPAQQLITGCKHARFYLLVWLVSVG